MPRHYMFGSDPEFIVVKMGPNRTISSFLHASSVFNGGTRGHIGNNGAQIPAELRTDAYPTMDQLYNGTGNAIRRLLDGALRQARQSQHTEDIGFVFGANPSRHDPIGGHIHITTDDMEWYWSKEAVHLLHLFITVPCFMYYKPSVTRAQNHEYGNYGNWHPSPDPHQTGQVDIPIPGAQRSRKGWSGGFTGWEYRAPPSWIGPTPEGERFRAILHKNIDAVCFGTEEQKRKQWEFFVDMMERLNLQWYNDLFQASSQVAYDRIIKSLKLENSSNYTHVGGRSPLREFFRDAEDFGRLIRAMKEAQEAHPLEGFGTFFEDMDPARPYHIQIDMGKLWTGTPRIELPIPMRTYATPRDTITALTESYQAFVESTHKNDWVSNGKAWYEIFPNHFIVADGVARDVHVPDIAYIAYGLCVDAVQRRGIKTKFLPRMSGQTHIYGGAEARFPSSTDAVQLPNDMQRNPHVAALLATEGLTAAASGDNHIYMRSTFRNSPSKLKYIIVALYILWMQKYIRGVGPSGAEIAEENPVPLGRNVVPLDVLV